MISKNHHTILGLYICIALLCSFLQATCLASHNEILVQKLLSSNQTIRGNALSQIIDSDIETKKDIISSLSTALQSKDSNMRAKAIEAIGRLPIKAGGKLEVSIIKEVTPLLIQALHDKDWQVRSLAAMGLGNIEAKESIPVLTKALNDENSEVRQWAANALGNIGTESKEAIPALIQRLFEDNNVSYHAAEALAKIGTPSLSPLMQLLKEQNKGALKWAAYGIGRIGPSAKEAAPLLGNALNDQDEQVRIAAVQALGDIGPEAKASVPSLIKALKEEWSYYHAAITLGKIGPSAKGAIPALIETLNDNRSEVSHEAALALVKIDPPKATPAIPVLIQWLLEEQDECDTSDETISAALVKIGKPAVPLLINTLRSKNSFVRHLSAKILGEIGTDAKDAAPILVKLLKDKDHDVRESAKEALEKIRTSK